jgi:alpha-D-xyloside xylohydrolase
VVLITKNSAKPLNLENPDGKLVTYNGKALTVQL